MESEKKWRRIAKTDDLLLEHDVTREFVELRSFFSCKFSIDSQENLILFKNTNKIADCHRCARKREVENRKYADF